MGRRHPACVNTVSSDILEIITLEKGHDSGESSCNPKWFITKVIIKEEMQTNMSKQMKRFLISESSELWIVHTYPYAQVCMR